MSAQVMQEVTGSIGPARVMRSIMRELNLHRQTQPLQITKGLEKKEVCRDNGQLKSANHHCDSYHEYFIAMDNTFYIQ